MSQAVSEGFWCSEYSIQSHEPLIGTATHARVWLLLEYPGRWEPKAYEDGDLPESVRAHVDAHVARMSGGVKVQLVRQEGSRDRAGHTLFVAVTDDPSPGVYRFTLDSYEDIQSIDLAAVAAPEAAYASFRLSDPLVAVCTHGKRDRCCARHGVAVYEALQGEWGENLWQTSHIGGHRFAANVLHFPHGIAYGRVRAEDAPSLSGAIRGGNIYPDRLRGRVRYRGGEQAAETFLRQAEGEWAIGAFRLVDSQSGQDGNLSVTFADLDGQSYRIDLRIDPGGYEGYFSCGDETPQKAARYELIGIDPA